ncbi:CDP-diacylglycerol--glycerol-3-phosphate 3-phosphatidyltransferase [Leptospira gomenensis]|uniref:CDP-diacylglycerol--glycerol-3-phosphate 3-phosphatidyltransferase n=1 Tax=Leptospira gomenensis TaxID=2484974 RepID=A0A5F1Z280_9LEPT|nr:CDP-diacylglycerol--glycerol-3-phosphate 3-phosphatidyltransferase [Leptospira gomenensis]TGK31052.1 CDP-diacylglycerol--glycerol-3-phosphate 3-phosphatidyltransferase [Leptospira gomenensis]TGK43257.1 CDP-diacylglycerol--glycerol-3-phosphate 3-phosphatidyltransferase [Leptospira gomenensis]TGK45228.1 CDP-diacylglycerol--glycerol-3-phosphate 3-phosphatidyltransferase [Leptospira gomenensis]TGK66143.1 CDP-diacylglycerol--glycerol-3-phosphate 3-phosphatidyltransferase [Leptospira gomenensis]
MKKIIFNIPNILTMLRVAAVPFFVWFLFQKEWEYHIAALVLFSAASLTDLIDGYLARKWNQETEFGKFLDPLADKIIVTGCFITFIFLQEQIEFWMVFLIIARDMLITSLRYLAIRQGKSIRTTMLGKIKTVFQMGAIVLILIFFILVSSKKRILINEAYAHGKASGLTVFEIATGNAVYFFQNLNKNTGIGDVIFGLGAFVPYWGMLVTTAITVISGIRYFVTNKEVLYPSNLKRMFEKNGTKSGRS